MVFFFGEKRPRGIASWDGQFHGYFSYDNLRKLVSQVNVLGPFAGFYGRDIEQELISPTSGSLISVRKFNQSVNLLYMALKATHFDQHPNEAHSVRDNRSEVESTREASHRPRRD